MHKGWIWSLCQGYDTFNLDKHGSIRWCLSCRRLGPQWTYFTDAPRDRLYGTVLDILHEKNICASKDFFEI